MIFSGSNITNVGPTLIEIHMHMYEPMHSVLHPGNMSTDFNISNIS